MAGPAFGGLKMGIAMSNALALMRVHSYRFFHNSMGFDDFTWLLIGVVIVLVVVMTLMQRRRRWF
jgi:hypothetical protein